MKRRNLLILGLLLVSIWSARDAIRGQVAPVLPLVTVYYQIIPAPEQPEVVQYRGVPSLPSTPLPTPVAPPAVALVKAQGKIASTHELLWPVTGKITTYFWSGHRGIDISVAAGTPVVAARAGTVIMAGMTNNGGGLAIQIDHHDGYITIYDHLGSIAVVPDQGIGAGGIIGGAGCTGVCTGPHLHFAVRIGGALVNPLRYL